MIEQIIKVRRIFISNLLMLIIIETETFKLGIISINSSCRIVQGHIVLRLDKLI